MKPKYAIQCLRTTNDVNGNARRVWVAYDLTTGFIVGTCDEGCAGLTRLASDVPNEATIDLGVLDTNISTYRDLAKKGNYPNYPFVGRS